MKALTETEHEPLNWNNSGNNFSFPNMIRIAVPLDGNCMFHAIAKAYFKPYITGKINGKHLNRSKFIMNLRQDLANMLGTKVNPADPKSKTYYETLSKGELPKIAESLTEYSLKNMQRELGSASPISNIYNEFISDQLDIDIYILDGIKKDVYMTATDDKLLYKNRKSVVILYLPGHYELVGLMKNNYVTTLFDHDSEFILAIRQRMTELRE